MYICKVHAQCGSRFSEIVPDNVEDVELLLEDVMSQVLLTLFGQGVVDDVSIHFVPYAYLKLKYYFIQIHAQCASEEFTLLPRTEEHIKDAISRTIGKLLKELFLSAAVDAVTLTPAP
jgi:hypothetical protein